MIQTSEQTEKIDAALSKVLSDVGGLKKDAKNPHFKSTYASLAAIWLVLRPALQAAGIAVNQHVLESETGTLRLQTRIALDGQWVTSVATFPVVKWDPQGFGSTITYAKRYTLAAIFGMAEDDDDGNTAAAPPKGNADATETAPPTGIKKPPVEPPPPNPAEYISKIAGIRARRNIERDALRDYIRAAWPKENMSDLSKQAFESIVGFLDRDQTTNEAVMIEVKRLRAQSR